MLARDQLVKLGGAVQVHLRRLPGRGAPRPPAPRHLREEERAGAEVGLDARLLVALPGLGLLPGALAVALHDLHGLLGLLRGLLRGARGARGGSVVLGALRADGLLHGLDPGHEPGAGVPRQLRPLRREIQRVGPELGIEVESADAVRVPSLLVRVVRTHQLLGGRVPAERSDLLGLHVQEKPCPRNADVLGAPAGVHVM
mmetsp:Transcript_75640/g.231537  ORF Transcript_75640/g.231537 Transcript_75640/m.231537 type:complete len:200 (+) Transcript_75640:107-706(+)